jgi:hypothetical protein
MKEICDRFNKHNFHDSKLMLFQSIRQKEEEIITENVNFEIEILKKNSSGISEYKKAKLIFKDCRIIKMDLDLIGKRYCSDCVMNAVCSIDSQLNSNIENNYFRRGPVSLGNDNLKNVLDGYLYFNIKLIPPGGEIDVFAKNFELIML